MKGKNDMRIKRKIGVLVILGMLMTIALSTSVTAIFDPDDDIDMDDTQWIGLGSTDGRIIFHEQGTTDEIEVADARLGIGDTSPDFKLEVAVSSDDGYFGVSSAVDNDGDVFIIDSSGNVGIGTAAPQRLLHLSKSGSPEIVIENSGANSNQKIWRIRGQSGTVSNLHFESMNDAFSARTSVMTLTRDDKVIIGNYLLPLGNPQEVKLEVQGAIEISDPIPGTHLFYGTNEFAAPIGDGYRIRYDNNFFGTNDDALIIEKTDGNDPIPDGGIAFVNTGYLGGVEPAMVIKGNGNVGIGTATPVNSLDVGGNVAIGPSYGGTLSAPPDGMLIQGAVGIGYVTAGNAKLAVNGKVGIGTIDPKTDLHIDGEGILGFKVDNRDPSGSSGVVKMYIDIDEYVGRTEYELMLCFPDGTKECVYRYTDWF